MTPTKAKINAALGITDTATAYTLASKADLAAVAEIILAALPEKPTPQAADDTYLHIAALCRVTGVTYEHAKAVIAHQRNIGRIRTATKGVRVDYHLGDFKRNLAATPYTPRRRRIEP